MRAQGEEGGVMEQGLDPVAGRPREGVGERIPTQSRGADPHPHGLCDVSGGRAFGPQSGMFPIGGREVT